MVWSNIFLGLGKSTDPFRWLTLPAKEIKRDILPVKKETDISGYLLDVTRKALLSFTTSLTKVSSQVHGFFSGLSQYLAFERLMQSCFGWAMPAASPFDMSAGVSQIWPMITSFWFPAMAQPQLQLQPQPQPKMFSWWGGEMFEAPKPQAPAMLPMDVTGAGMPIYSAAMA
ncbi:MAG: hypothetical protein P8Y36_12340, partial [Alphaproteobacteria bacterium]